jgi:hypothetical protein
MVSIGKVEGAIQEVLRGHWPAFDENGHAIPSMAGLPPRRQYSARSM